MELKETEKCLDSCDCVSMDLTTVGLYLIFITSRPLFSIIIAFSLQLKLLLATTSEIKKKWS